MDLIGSKVKSPSLRRHLKPILDSWLKINREYSNYDSEDGLYFYTERATLSTLAGAVWKVGGFALEEYSDVKGYGAKRKNGRTDLWFTCENQKNEFIVEAKQRWPIISDRANAIHNTLVTGLKDAVSDAKKVEVTYRGFGVKFLGVLFAVPKLPPSDQADEHIEERLKRFIEEVEKVDCSFYGYFLSSESKVIGQDGRLYPGVAILGKLI